jgi:hypothetical protein
VVIVGHSNSNHQAIMEINTSNYSIEVVFSQDFEKLLYLVVFYLRQMVLADQNYNIYERKRLPIV